MQEKANLLESVAHCVDRSTRKKISDLQTLKAELAVGDLEPLFCTLIDHIAAVIFELQELRTELDELKQNPIFPRD